MVGAPASSRWSPPDRRHSPSRHSPAFAGASSAKAGIHGRTRPDRRRPSSAVIAAPSLPCRPAVFRSDAIQSPIAGSPPRIPDHAGRRPGEAVGARGAAAPAKNRSLVVFQWVTLKKQGKSRAKTGRNRSQTRGKPGAIRVPKPPAGRPRRPGRLALPGSGPVERGGICVVAHTIYGCREAAHGKLHCGRRRTLRGEPPQGFGRVRIVDCGQILT